MCVQRHKHASVTKSSRYCGHLIKFDGSFLNDEVKWKELLKGGSQRVYRSTVNRQQRSMAIGCDAKAREYLDGDMI